MMIDAFSRNRRGVMDHHSVKPATKATDEPNNPRFGKHDSKTPMISVCIFLILVRASEKHWWNWDYGWDYGYGCHGSKYLEIIFCINSFAHIR